MEISLRDRTELGRGDQASCIKNRLALEYPRDVGKPKAKTRSFGFVILTAFTLVGCSDKTEEEKAVEAIQEVFGDAYGSMPSENTISRDVARTWPEKFCSLETNMSREQVRSVMGEPTLTFSDSSANQDQYEAWGYSLTIFYDIDDLANVIQANSDNVPCETKFRD